MSTRAQEVEKVLEGIEGVCPAVPCAGAWTLTTQRSTYVFLDGVCVAAFALREGSAHVLEEVRGMHLLGFLPAGAGALAGVWGPDASAVLGRRGGSSEARVYAITSPARSFERGAAAASVAPRAASA